MLLARTGARIVTGPMPMADSELSVRMRARRDALAFVTGYAITPPVKGVRYLMPSASVYWEGCSKRVLVAVETDVTPYDWAQVLDILRMCGWMIGRPDFDDIGEPIHDTETEVWICGPLSWGSIRVVFV
jgi:hypothetical protein